MSIAFTAPAHPIAPKPPRPNHRPSGYTPELADRIIERIAESNDSLRTIAKDPDMPSRHTLNRWKKEHPEFEEAYREANQGRIEDIAWECLEIADDSSGDTKVNITDDGSATVLLDKEHIERVKIQLSERHRICAKIAPRRFGDKPDPEPAPQQAQLPSQQVASPDFIRQFGDAHRPSMEHYQRALAERAAK